MVRDAGTASNDRRTHVHPPSGLTRRLAALLLVLAIALGSPASLSARTFASPSAAAGPDATLAIAPAPAPVWGTKHVVRAAPDEEWAVTGALRRTVAGETTYLHAAATSGGQGADGGVYYARSAYDTATWAKQKRLNGTTQMGEAVALASSSPNVYASWTRLGSGGTRIAYVRRNSSNGLLSHWLDSIRLSSATGKVDATSISAAGSSVYVVYTISSSGSIRLRTSRNHGTTWSGATLGTTTRTAVGLPGRSGGAMVAAYGTTIGVFWMAATNTVVGRVSTDSGVHWGTTRTIGPGRLASVNALGSRLAVAGLASDGTVWVRVRSTAGWGTRRFVPHDPVLPQSVPAVALRGSNEVGVAYGVIVPDPPGGDPNDEVFWRSSADGGATWTAPDSVSGVTEEDHGRPSVVWRSAGRALYVMWTASYDDGSVVLIRARM